jgi:hypothetical protein
MVEPEAPTAEIGHTIVQWSSGIVRMEEAGGLTNHREGPDMDCCPRSELTVARHETVRILGADAHMRQRLWYIVHGRSKLSRITY